MPDRSTQHLAISGLSHDLRNLLAVTALKLEQLSAHHDPFVRSHCSVALGSIWQAVELCNRSITLARHEQIDTHEEIDLGRLIEDAVAVAVPGPDPGILCQIMLDPDFIQIRSCRVRLFRILFNLIHNAATASKDRRDGMILIHASTRSGAGAYIDIADDGPGLPPRIHRFFTRAEPLPDSVGGHGLGLPLTGHLAIDIGAELALVRSGPRGTVLRLSPLPLAAPPPIAPTEPGLAANTSILG